MNPWYSRLLLVTACLLGCRASPRKAEPPPVCSLVLPKHLRDSNPDTLPGPVWYELLFKGYRAGLPQDLVDCSGETISAPTVQASCAEGEPDRAKLALPLEQDVVVRHADGGYWFVWAPYVRFESGLREGPVAIARIRDDRLEVRALGTLRGYGERVHLETRRLGSQHILVAEGEHCRAGGACERATRLMWLDRQRFRERPLRSSTIRSCLGPAWLPHAETRKSKLGVRWERTLRRELALGFDDDAIVVDEHILVNDQDLEQRAAPPKLFREAQAQMKISLSEGEFLMEGKSLWPAVLIEDGSTSTPGP